MSWAKLDDSFFDHPKTLAAGPQAGWLWTLSLSYCARHRQTEGFLADQALSLLVHCAGLKRAEGQRAANRLVEIGLWEVAEGGHRIHDWLEYQPFNEPAQALREMGKLGGKKSAETRRQKYGSAQPRPRTASGTASAEALRRTLPPNRPEAHPSRPVPVPITPPNPLLEASRNGVQAEAFAEVQGDNAAAVNEALANIQQRAATKPTLSGFIRTALDTFTEVTGRQPTRLDIGTVEEWERDMRYLEAGDVRDRMRSMAGHWKSQGKDPARTMAAFSGGMQAQNAFLADAGRRKAR